MSNDDLEHIMNIISDSIQNPHQLKSGRPITAALRILRMRKKAKTVSL